MVLAALILLGIAQHPISPDPEPISISGVVVDSRESGPARLVPDAEIWLAEALPPDEGRRSGMELWWTSLTQPSEESPEVLIHARSDAKGQFTLQVPAEVPARRSSPPLVLWAMTGVGVERRLAVHRLPRIVLADDPPVRLELRPRARAAITVRDPDLRPVTGAKVLIARALENQVPGPIARDFMAETDANGRAVLLGLPADAIRIETPLFGTQVVQAGAFARENVSNSDSEHASAAVVLAPVGRLAGRLVAPESVRFSGVSIHATTQAGGYSGSGIVGIAQASCDPQGRFEIPAIAQGTLALTLEFDRADDMALRGEPLKGLVVTTGKTTEVTIALHSTLKVQGLVREKGTNRPIAGVKVALNGQQGGDRFAMTDSTGKFTGRIMRDLSQPFGWPVRVPAPFYYPTDQAEMPQGMPQRGREELMLPPTELPRGIEVTGVVVGENNQGAPGALVEAIWTTADGMAQAALARTHRSGSFTLHGIDPLAELNLTAWTDVASTQTAVTVRAESARTGRITLTISPKNSAPIGGRVLDQAGRGVTGASIRIWREVRDKNGRAIVIDPIVGEEGPIRLLSDASGRYRTTRRVSLSGSYYAEATASERVSARSAQVTLAGRPHELPVLVLRRVRTIDGRVVDRQGRPVKGATVRQSGDGPLPTQTVSDEDGRFRLAGTVDGPAFVFALKTGFRFHFQAIDSGATPVRIALEQTGQPQAVSYRTLAGALPIHEEKAMARRLIEDHTKHVLDHGSDADKFRCLIDALAIDPFHVLEQLETVKFNDPDYLTNVRVNLVGALARENVDDAIAQIEALSGAETRAQCYLSICDVRRDLAPDRLKEVLTQAKLNAQSVKSGKRFVIDANIADRWIDLGDTGRARTLLDQALELGKSESKGTAGRGFELGIVAEALARLDLPAALEVLDDLARVVKKRDTRDRSYVFDRFYGRIAFKLAAQSPADAERVLARIPIMPGGDRCVVAVCAKMAPKDIARARKIVESRISPGAPANGPYAWGLMAQAMISTGKVTAMQLLDQAYARLDELAAGGQGRSRPDFVEVAVGLLPVVEQVEPDRLPEFLGRTLALRPPRGDQTERNEPGLAGTTAALAMLIARYDRNLAARLLEPELRKIRTYEGLFGADYVTWRVIAALAVIDPERAVKYVEALPDDPGSGTDSETTKNLARMNVAKLLALHGADRWRHIYEYFIYLWTPDQRYL